MSHKGGTDPDKSGNLGVLNALYFHKHFTSILASLTIN